MGAVFRELCRTSARAYRGSTIGAMGCWCWEGSGYSLSELLLCQEQGICAGGMVLLRRVGVAGGLDKGGDVSSDEGHVCA